MKKLSACIAAMLCLAVSCIHDKPTGADLAPGDSIPDFTVTMDDGTSVTGKQLRKGFSVVVFFTTKCPDCRETLPQIQRLYDEYSPQGVQFAIISREDGQEPVAQYWSEQGYTMPYSAQADRKVYELFAKSRVPRVYICKEGIIKFLFTDDPNPTYDDLSLRLNDVMIKY